MWFRQLDDGNGLRGTARPSFRCGVAGLVLATAVAAVGCGRTTGLKGQANGSITFFGVAVDQDGRPLAGVRVEYEVEAFPPNWTFETRGKPLHKSNAVAISDRDGRFTFTAEAHTLRRTQVDAPQGYRHLYEQYEGTLSGRTIPSTFGYLVMSWGDRCFKIDAEHPAVFVFVKDGVTEVSALPCRGGFSSGNGAHWVENRPAWPEQPSLAGVVQKKPDAKPIGG